MSRRARHPPDEMRQLFIDTTLQIVVESGLHGVSAREVARRLGYVAGSLYNVFPDLDSLLLAAQEQVLLCLNGDLETAASASSPQERLAALARAYLRFAGANPRLWNLLAEHALRPERTPSASFDQCFAQLVAHFEKAVLDGGDTSVQAGRTIWAAAHGFAALMTSPKVSAITAGEAEAMLDCLLERHAASLQRRLRA